MKYMQSIILSSLLAIVLIITIVDAFIWQTSVEAIYTGKPFFYWSHVSVFARLPLSLVGVIFIGVWLFTRKMMPILDAIRWWMVMMLIAACGLFSFVAPLGNVTETARHLDGINYSGNIYRLFTQYSGIGDETCDTVLVQCDSFGMQCTYISDWLVTPICLGDKTPAYLTTIEDNLQVIGKNDTLYVVESSE